MNEKYDQTPEGEKIIGCYIDRNYIKKADDAYTQYLDDMSGMADELELSERAGRKAIREC